MTREKIANNVYFNSYTDNKFKNNILVVRFILPLEKETASRYAMVPYLLTISSKEHDSVVKLNKKLDDLYGANLWGDVEKIGSYQVLSVGINFIDKRYSINPTEDINAECFDLLLSVLKEPDLLNGFFKDEHIDIVKHILTNKIKDRLNNKAVYAMERCKELMFEDQGLNNLANLSVSKFGAQEYIDLITKQEATSAYYQVINKSRIEINYVGNKDNLLPIKSEFKRLFKRYVSYVKFDLEFPLLECKPQVLTVEEKLDIKQCNLVLGFKISDVIMIEHKLRALTVVNLLFGGTPFSKLFVNVREKMSLCYNCVSRYDKFSNSVLVFMGLQFEDKEKAIKEVLSQLEEIKNGNFSETDLENTKLTIIDTLLRSKDSVDETDRWYFRQNVLEISGKIEEEIMAVSRISKKQVVEAAGTIKLDTVYVLKGAD